MLLMRCLTSCEVNKQASKHDVDNYNINDLRMASLFDDERKESKFAIYTQGRLQYLTKTKLTFKSLIIAFPSISQELGSII
jgi:hypothetical protein